MAVFEKYNKSKFQVVRNTARSFWRNTRKRTEELRILLVLLVLVVLVVLVVPVVGWVYEQYARRGEDDLVARIVIAILLHKGYIKRVC